MEFSKRDVNNMYYSSRYLKPHKDKKPIIDKGFARGYIRQ